MKDVTVDWKTPLPVSADLFDYTNISAATLHVPVGTDGKGTIALNLAIPSDITLTGSFEIQFPEGMALDEASTALALELSDRFSLSFTDEGNNTRLIEIKSNDLKSSTATEYRKIMDIAYCRGFRQYKQRFLPSFGMRLILSGKRGKGVATRLEAAPSSLQLNPNPANN